MEGCNLARVSLTDHQVNLPPGSRQCNHRVCLMKVLLAMPLSPSLLDVLDTYGHAGVHAYPIDQGRASDRELLEIARRV
jgi:hypothetical protein